MSKPIDINTWYRKEQYYFFKDHDLPFFNMTAPVDVTKLRRYCKEKGYSFFLSSLYLSLQAANNIPEFRYRIREEGVVEHERIYAGSTVLFEDNTFGFGWFMYEADLATFCVKGEAAIAELKQRKKLVDKPIEEDDVLHYSVIPWVSFTSFQHARKFRKGDSIPKLVFGKYYDENGRTKMPLSVEVHHALMDGWHVGQYFQEFQRLLDEV